MENQQAPAQPAQANYSPAIDPSQMRYEQARDELVAIVKKLESGSAPLEETLALWERGEALAGRCHAILSNAESRMTRMANPPQPPAQG